MFLNPYRQMPPSSSSRDSTTTTKGKSRRDDFSWHEKYSGTTRKNAQGLGRNL